MIKPSFNGIVQSIKISLGQHSPQILTGIGIAGMVTTTVLAVKATPKALQLLEEAKNEHLDDSMLVRKELTPFETVKAVWRPYLPAVLSGAAATICLVGACSVNTRRVAVLASAYKLSETALSEYKDAVLETIGEKKAKTVRDKVAENRVKNNPVDTDTILVTQAGNTLCYDSFGGRYFRSDMNTIKKAENEMNACLRNENYISLNAVYELLGLEYTKMGSELGWNIDRLENYLIDIEVSTQIASNGEPCLVIDFSELPTYDFAY